jgi:hypothetical protein
LFDTPTWGGFGSDFVDFELMRGEHERFSTVACCKRFDGIGIATLAAIMASLK